MSIVRPKGWNRSQWFGMPREERRPLARLRVAPHEYWYARLRLAEERQDFMLKAFARHLFASTQNEAAA